MFSTTDTIVAIATPPGRGGIGVVRLSGPDAHAIARGLIAARSRSRLRHATSRGPSRRIRRTIRSPCDRVRAPAGRLATPSIRSSPPSFLPRILHRRRRRRAERAWQPGRAARDRRRRRSPRGARLAEPGEFTLRAFLNGRIDLMQAEAVADLIDAVTPLQARAAFDQLERHADARDRRASTRRCSI